MEDRGQVVHRHHRRPGAPAREGDQGRPEEVDVVASEPAWQLHLLPPDAEWCALSLHFDARLAQLCVSAGGRVRHSEVAQPVAPRQLEQHLEGEEADSARLADERAHVDGDGRAICRAAQTRASSLAAATDRPAAALQTSIVVCPERVQLRV